MTLNLRSIWCVPLGPGFSLDIWGGENKVSIQEADQHPTLPCSAQSMVLIYYLGLFTNYGMLLWWVGDW